MVLADLQLPQQEGPTVEFKVQWSDTVKSTLCSFLNTRGGQIFFGVTDDGKVKGVEDVDKLERAIVSVMRFSMHPDASRLCKTTAVQEPRKLKNDAYARGLPKR